MKRLPLAFLAVTPALSLAFSSDKPLVARNPDLGSDKIVFEFGTDLWTVDKAGGKARRLTVGPGIEARPTISPDGQTVAFSGEYDGNVDVFVVSINGGQPKRLTFHPSQDTALGWTPDGSKVLFSSSMDHPNSQPRLYTVSENGSWPVALPLPRGMEGSFSPDAGSIAYVPNDLWQPEWKRYKGGQTTPIWIARLSDSKVTERIPRENSNDRFPMWIGKSVYFVSDRAGRSTLFSYDTGSDKVARLIAPHDLDIKSAAAGPGAIVFERIGGIYLYDLASKTEKKVPVELDDDFVEVRPGFRSVSDQISESEISPSGARAVFMARGDIFTVPVEKGDPRNITNTPGVAERSPIWSPDGKKIAYLSDADGNYKLHVVDQANGGNPEIHDMGDKPDWYRTIFWSPDSKKILFVDQSMNVGYYDLASKKATRFDKSPYYFFGETMAPTWSPDSKWITYARRLKNKLHAIFVYSLDTGKPTQITDGLSDAASPAFDKDGRNIYFMASTEVAQTISLGGMSGMGLAPVNYNIYVINLRADDPSPFAPQSDEEKGEPAPPAGGSGGAPGGGGPGGPGGGPGGPGGAGGRPSGPPPAPEVKIDFDGISQRILAVPGLPAAQYAAIVAATPGSILIARGPGLMTLLRFNEQTRQVTPFASNIFSLSITPRGDKALIMGTGGNQIVSTMAPAQPGQGAVNTSGLQMQVDPRAEWRQMFNEVWRNMRDFFYDANTHGVDIPKVKARYEPYLDQLASRQDYNYLMQDMLNEVSVGHTFSGGGEVPSGNFVPGGLLGADYKIENGRYRFARVYNGENWNPGLRAPLTQPGAVVKDGEYLLAVNGRNLTDKDNVYQAFENTANRQVSITVGPNPDGSGSRTVTVVPLASEGALRHRAWVEDNRRKVDNMSGGRISYVYIPSTGGSGFASFNRYFTAQLDKDAVLIDERFNSGGALADYVIQVLSRQVFGYAQQRDHGEIPIPTFSNEGPKAMLINEEAGSGGDAMPWFFKLAKLGPLVGTRTWGGLVAASSGVPLMAGGFATAPQMGIFGVDGEHHAENKGIAPDIHVEEDPFLWRQGKDQQLEAAVKYLVSELDKRGPRKERKLTFPNTLKGDKIGKGG